MKALQITAEKFFELLNKKRTDPNFTSEIVVMMYFS